MRSSPRSVVSGGPASLMLGLGLLAAAAYAVLWAFDLGTTGWFPHRLWSSPGAGEALGNMAEVTVGVLGVALTVVSIIVELAANRYTPRITEEFITDRVNGLSLGGFVLAALLVVWIDLSLPADGAPPMPWMTLAGAVVLSVSLLGLLPYFAYVFDFLSPHRLVERNGDAARAALASAARTGDLGHDALLHAVDQLGDIAVRSIQNQDKSIAIAAIDELSSLLHAAAVHKPQLPAGWFDATPALVADPDFAAFHRGVLDDLIPTRTWLEMKVLLQLHAAWREAQRGPREVAHLVAIQVRRAGSHVAAAGDVDALQLCVRFLNTFLRAAINSGDVRSAYNLLNEYRELATRLLDGPLTRFVPQLAEHLKSYGQLGFRARLAFILETVAYDLCTLLEAAFLQASPHHDALLRTFLDVDREPEGAAVQESALRGVRKAQVKLATFYLVHGRDDLARQIWQDMVREPPARLQSIREELERTTERVYQEVTDRGTNFDWLDPDRRAQLGRFFGWFAEPA